MEFISVRKRDIDILKKRRDFLEKRIGMSDKDLSYDKQECAALNRAINTLCELLRGSGRPF